jgi:hypothetical protein
LVLTRVWRCLGAVLVLGGSLVVTTRVGWAHSCATAVTVAEGVDTDVQVGVTIGDLAATAVTFEFPESMEITRTVDRRGWTVQQEESTIRFSEGRLEPQSCELFTVPIRAKDEGTFRVRAFQLTEQDQWVEHPPNRDVFMQPDGSSVVVNHAGEPNELFEQIIHVTSHEDATGRRNALIIATVVIGVVAAIYFVPRAGRPR